MIRKLQRVLLVLWAGSLWSLAIWVAPTLFSAQSDRHVAGLLAARLFTVETYLGVAVAVLAMLLPGRAKFVWGYLAVALLAINQGVLKPVMATAHARGAVAGLTFGAWHGVSAVIYMLACLAVLVLIWKEEFR
ncbi:MAG: conserved rane protein of unknown function [Gammaproteobacteria bacterium]|nr:conserved rane protein of unknown function [Gammaproteobacteria bacterium]